MSDNKPGTQLSAEELQAVSGGDCTPEQWLEILNQLKQSYETLIDFTSYVIERVAGTPEP